MLGQGAGGNPNMPQMVNHNSGTSMDVGNNYNNMGGLMQGNLSDINNMNQNMVVHINGPLPNISGFNPSMNNMSNMSQNQQN